ncbi:uncharacterized protein LOC144112720 isoform X1 [Amblyomma americanum]
MPAVVPSPAAVARGRHSPFQRRSFSLWLSLFRPSCCRQPRTSSGSWPNRILCHRAVTTVASTRDPRAVCQPAQVALNSSHKGCSRPHLLFKEIDQHAAEVAADTEELLELIVTWSHGLKKQNTLLVLLNHPQVPVAMQNGILQLVTHVDSKVCGLLMMTTGGFDFGGRKPLRQRCTVAVMFLVCTMWESKTRFFFP